MPKKVRFDELAEDFLNTYRVDSKKSLLRARRSVRQLTSFFGGMRARAITTAHVRSYIARRLSETSQSGGPPANATINRELAALKRIFNLARQSTPPKVYQVPYIPTLKEDNVRTGFLEHEEYQALKAAAPDYLKPVIVTGYHSGCRLGEILNLRWDQVNLRERKITLNPGETKNQEGRVIYLAEELYQVLAEQKALRDWNWPNLQHVFVREGKPIKSFRRSWLRACRLAGLEGLLFHDLRRTAVRNLVRAGVPEKVAMAISGHKTRSVFDRYNITSESDLARAAEALDAYHAAMGPPASEIEIAERIIEEVQKG